MHHLPPEFSAAEALYKGDLTGKKTLKSMEKLMILEALRRHEGSRKLAAKDLGIDYSTLYRKIKKLKIEAPSTDGRSRRQ
jgi:transcriptional regulator with PAS, ATPase and Fis domain